MEVVSDVQASEAAQWPSPIVEDFTAGWPVLCSESEEHDVEKWVINNKKILIRTSTWNLCAKPPPNIESLCANLLPTDR